MTDRPYEVSFAADRIADLLDRLERMVAHDPEVRLMISAAHDGRSATAIGCFHYSPDLLEIFAHSAFASA